MIFKQEKLFYFNFDPFDGRIYEISSNFKDVLNFVGIEINSLNEIDFDEKKFFIEDLFPNFNLAEYRS